MRYKVRYFDDIISDTEPLFKGNKRFKNYRELLKGINRRGHEDNNRIVKRICSTFLKLMMHDLIFKNYRFQMPLYNFCSLYIGYKKFTNTEFKYNINTGGPYYIARFEYTKEGRNRIHNTMYYPWLSKGYYKILMEEVNKGHKYSNI